MLIWQVTMKKLVEKTGDKMKCVICNGRIFGFGHNAEPVASGVCCDICNDTKVIPTRINNLLGAGGESVSNDGDGE